MKTALRVAAIIAVPLALAACNETSNGRGGGGLFGGSGGLFGNSGGDYDDGYGPRGRRGGGGPYAYNGQCDDAAYNTSNGGNAARGTDEFDCSRYGDGLKR